MTDSVKVGDRVKFSPTYLNRVPTSSKEWLRNLRGIVEELLHVNTVAVIRWLNDDRAMSLTNEPADELDIATDVIRIGDMFDLGEDDCIPRVAFVIDFAGPFIVARREGGYLPIAADNQWEYLHATLLGFPRLTYEDLRKIQDV